MSSTNKTTNYELSQYIGTDKPTYLGDYNSDMLKIDTQMKANATAVATAQSTANTANTNANSAQSTADTANTTATTANTTANSALAKALKNEANIENLNLTSVADVTFSNTGNGQILPRGATPLKVAKNSDGSLCKIYGVFRVQNFGNENILMTSADTGLRPQNDIVISPAGIRTFAYSTGFSVNDMPITIKTNGSIEMTIPYDAGFTWEDVYIFPFIIYVKDFGDVQPVNP